MAKVRTHVTLRWIRRTWTCSQEAAEAFKKKFGAKGKPTVHEVVKACHRRERNSWAGNILAKYLPSELKNQWTAEED